MSLHRSLKVNKLAKQRSVRKRWERVKYIMDNNGQNLPSSVFGLPKEKVVRIKAVKKEKKKVETDLTTLIK